MILDYNAVGGHAGLRCPGIYMIWCLFSGKVYVGSSLNVARRFTQHLRNLNRNRNLHPHLQAAWNAYGAESFMFTPIEFCSVEELEQREQHYLDLHRSYDREKGYNTSPTAESTRGVKRTPEQRERIRQAGIGRKASPETRAKMSVSNRASQAYRRTEFDVVSPRGELVHGVGISEFARQYGLCASNLGTLLQGKIKTTLGWSLPGHQIESDTFVHDDGRKVVVPRGIKGEARISPLGVMCQEHGLSLRGMHHVRFGETKAHRGWRLASA